MQNANRHTVVGLGEALWDMLPSGKHLGGAPLNFAYIASLLGEHAVVASRIGNDELGREIQAELRRRSLDLSGLQIDERLPTGTVNVTFRDGQPQYEICQPAAWDALEWTPEWQAIASHADALCFGTLAQRAERSRETIHAFVLNAPKHCLKVLDINLRRPFYSPEVIAQSLKIANVLKLNDLELSEIAAMFAIGGAMRSQMSELLRKFELRYVLVTRGEHGAMAASRTECVEHPGFQVQVRDTIGAGDAFTASAIHCLLRCVGLEKTLAFANKWAAWVASQAGGMPEIDANERATMLNQTAS